MPPFILVDGSYYLFRAFHALPPLTTSQGQTTNAIKGALSALQKLMRRMQPTHMAVVFDTPEPTFRHQLSPEYKAHRPAMPSELSTQIPYLHAIIKGLGIPLLLLPGAEADDLIGTLAKRAVTEGHHVLISTGDKDMAQLVNDHIKLEDSFRDQVLDHDGVIAKFGVRPDQIIDYLTLMGDASDGIAGVPGVGKVTAAKLLNQYQTIGGILENAHLIKGKVGESIRENADKIPLNHQLASIVCDLPLALDWHELKLGKPDVPALKKLYAELEFRALLQSLEHPNNPDNQPDYTQRNESSVPSQTKEKEDIPQVLNVESMAVLESSTPITEAKYHTILDQSAFLALVERLKIAPRFAVDTETTSLDYRLARIVGISVALKAGEAYYIPIGHDYMGAPEQLDATFVFETLKPILENPAIGKIGQHMKYDAHLFNNHGISLQGWAFDTMLASYVLNPTATRHGMDDLAQYYLDYKTTTFEEIAGKGVKQLTFNQIELERAAPYAAEDADITWRLYEHFSKELAKIPKLQRLLLDVEMPTAQVLYEMENNGIRLDIGFLAELGQKFGEQIHGLEAQAIEIAGQPFNVSSPKQLGEILFDKLGIAGGKKTASGQYATGEAILEKIDHPMIATILEYRSLSKLKSTYTDSLIAQSDPVSHRVHTSYHQAIAATGRLSSTDPNLQNIPIRGEVGRQIRQAFIAPPGRIILAADYSQIELRLMAHFSQDAALLTAFREGRDIHQATAAEVMGIDLADVTSDQRRQAKAINFGLLYGMSAFGLAKQLNLSRAEAQEYITLYFSRYPSVHDYMENTRTLAAEQGYVETVLGRRLYMENIRAGNAMVRQAAERAAINAPLQGSAADIIKLAMISVDQALPKQYAKMLLQVHDELVFEVDEDKADEVTALLKKLMPAVLKGRAEIDVPLEIEVGRGINWGVAH
ncbi:DNA polymerase I [Aquirhabdus parva]|uniref:DNA polymerase I n=1 Tax=Aquirhabdus parva TaxID=2283318 RepID=A0A345P5G4_9GAMM|nr:DNA polymerase I [Aquirhabdus parva]AXI02523.1 DNA polymerase I [Aquirhabdus parva]